MAKPIVDVYDFIYKMAFNLLECHHLSLDMAQRIFLEYTKKLQKTPNMDEDYKRFWVIRTTKNKCLNYIRNNKRISFVDPVNFLDFVDYSPDARQIIEQNEEKQNLYTELKNNINYLTENQKQILHLRFYEELPYKEITRLTGFSETKAKTLVYRAVKSLKSKMSRH